MTPYEQCARDAIDALAQSEAPMTELEPLVEYIRLGYPIHYSELRRDLLIDSARHAAKIQRAMLRAMRNEQ